MNKNFVIAFLSKDKDIIIILQTYGLENKKGADNKYCQPLLKFNKYKKYNIIITIKMAKFEYEDPLVVKSWLEKQHEDNQTK